MQVAGYPSVFAHGMLSSMLTNYVGDGRHRLWRSVYLTGFPWCHLDGDCDDRSIREENGEHFVDISVSTKDEEGVEVIKGQASAKVDP